MLQKLLADRFQLAITGANLAPKLASGTADPDGLRFGARLGNAFVRH